MLELYTTTVQSKNWCLLVSHAAIVRIRPDLLYSVASAVCGHIYTVNRGLFYVRSKSGAEGPYGAHNTPSIQRQFMAVKSVGDTFTVQQTALGGWQCPSS